jgi:CHAT domain-containing protein
LAIFEAAFGPEHPSVARSLNNIGGLHNEQNEPALAEPFFNRALALREKTYGPGHPALANSLANVARVFRDLGRIDDAVDYIRRATEIHRGRVLHSGERRSGAGLGEQRSVSYIFWGHIDIVHSIGARDPGSRDALAAEAFEVGQLAQARSAAQAVTQMAARFGAGDDDLGRTVRARQDALDRWQGLDKRLTETLSKPPEARDAQAEAGLRSELERIGHHLEALDAELARAFPAYAELATPSPVLLDEVRTLLGADEALVTYVAAGSRTFLWAMRRDRAEMFRLEIGRDDLAKAVAELRRTLDPTGIRSLEDIPPFDVTRAYDLYAKLFAPAEQLLDGVRHLFVVPDGALQSLPLGVLVSAEPQESFVDFSGYRQTPWLAKKYAMTTLPSVSSLRALRRFAKASRARRAFLGIGDPLLKDHPRAGKSPTREAVPLEVAAVNWEVIYPRGVDMANLFRGGLADVELLRRVPSLPETATELAAIAASLGAGSESLVLREAAMEDRVRAGLPLPDTKVIAFATHAVVAGELKGLAEPALILTPPEVATKADDGLLTASEIAALDLDADWVILSACNTASSDGKLDADGLSGLAKAFFYAGTRALLVSHWPVASNAAVKLTTGLFKEAAAHPEIGRAEALRRSMLALMDDKEAPHFAHPMFWAPFVVVGEGGAR